MPPALLAPPLMGLLLSAALADAPAPPPADSARRLTLSGTATVRPDVDTVVVFGRALMPSGVLHDRALYLSMETGGRGIWLYSRAASGLRVAAGDSLEATGVLHSYRGTLEVVASRVRVVASATEAPPVPPMQPAAAAPVLAAEGRLVRVRGVVGAQGESEGGRWLRVHRADGGGPDSVTVWTPPAHQNAPDLASLRPGDEIEATGIAALYRDNPTDPPIAQLVPRGPEDVVTIGIPGRWRELALNGLLATLGLAAAGWAVARAATRRHARMLRETEARYQQLLALSPDAVIVHDDERVLFANPAAALLLGAADAQALAGRPLESFLGAEERTAMAVAATVRPVPHAPPLGRRLRTRMRGANGTPVDVEVATSPCRYSDRDAAVLVARDIGPQLRYERELRELALLDELTGLHNRRGFLTFAEAELRRLRQSGRGAALLFADLDGLKRINDAHGHAAGDEALIAVAHGLREVVGAQGLVARWSGDEFVALVPEPEGRSADDAAVAEAYELRLRDALARRRSPHAPYVASATVGAHHLPADGGETLAAALAAADAGLYRRRASTRPVIIISP
jgi:diguanylate cyclase (GGDEF)-like protein/PAS domain S-box-containing protein